MARRTWEMKNELDSSGKDSAEAYEEYLLLLQQRNRLLAKLKEKDENQLELERKEQGFSLYYNGANVGLHLSGHHKSRQTKTAGETMKREVYKSEYSSSSTRVKTAPSKVTRKGWDHSPQETIQIKTEKGNKVKLDLPGICSGKYSDDFEVYQSFLESKLIEEHVEESEEETGEDQSESEDDSDASEEDSDASEEMDHNLTFTVQDVKALRVSLENDTSIMKSIASISEELVNNDSDEEGSHSTGHIFNEAEEELSKCSINSGNEVDKKDISEELINSEHSDTDSDPEDETIGVKRNYSNKHTELHELMGASPKARPVSASRKQTDNSSTIDPMISEDILAAIAEENKKLMEYQENRQTKTAPSLHKSNIPKIDEDRPVTISSTLTEDEIYIITEKVRGLTGRQQKKLLKMLGEIDIVEEDITENWDSKKDKNRKYLEEEKNNRKASPTTSSCLEDSSGNIHSKMQNVKMYKDIDNTSPEPTKHMQTLTSSGEMNEIESLKSSNETISDNNCLEVIVELVSNWGNERFIGLTEIQFIDNTNTPIKPCPKKFKLFGASGLVEDLKKLINSKTKTTKDKYMWKCDYHANEKIKIAVSLPECEFSKLRKIIIWNYNRSLQELNVGVKDCNVYSCGKLVWQGVIEKGCGNQIFDYSYVIHVNVDLDKSDDNTIKEDRCKYSITPDDDCYDRGNDEINSTDIPVTTYQTPMVNRVSGDMKGLHTADSNVSRSTNTQKQGVLNANVESNFETKKLAKSKETLKERSSASTGVKPVWLEDSVKVKKQKDTSFFEEKRVSRPTSGRRSQNTPDYIEEPIAVRRPVSGRRSQQSCSPDIDEEEVKARKEIDDLFDLNAIPRRLAGTNRREFRSSNTGQEKTSSVETFSRDSGPLLFDMPSQDIKKSERQQFKETIDTNLEQSFQSINNFNFHHLGRITASIDDDSDVLKSFLQPMKQKDVIALHEGTMVTEKTNTEAEFSEPEVLFDFPVLPKGKELIINIKTTWGDRHYVGLNGIEVFAKSGDLIQINNIQAHPADINVLPEYDGDPRVVSNLIDGCYLTRDDLHLWLTPFTPEGDHFLELEFVEEAEIAMIRIWNYNKSRIHSTRGARIVEMALGGKLIFIGEIARASGVLSKEDPYGDTILFTTDENILLLVAANDFTYEVDSDDDEDFLMASKNVNLRPQTADKADDPTERPFTCPKSRQHSRGSERNEESTLEPTLSPDGGFMQCKVLTIFFCETWADQHYLGLTGLEILGKTFEKLPLELRMIEADPSDLNCLEDYDDDDRTLDKLINGINVTTSDENMWLIPFDEHETHILKVTFDDYTIVTGLRMWNYNKSLEDTFRGVKTIHVYLDDHVISPKNGLLIRKGPGHCHFDFAQDILFIDPDALNEAEFPESSRQRKINLQKIVNEYETIMMPSGFVFQFKLFSSWGDQYYIGLNGIEVYDKIGEKINLSDNNITAYPHSVNILDGVDEDVRTPDKLVNGVNDTYDGRHMWLAPILPGQVNIIYIVFDEPVTISMIKIWNYSKTPARGVRNFGLLVDDLLVYSGVLPQCGLYARAIIPGMQLPVTHHTILFSDNEEIALKERKHLMSSSISFAEQNIQLTNDRAVLNPYRDRNESKSQADPSMRPMTSVTSIGKFQVKERR